MPLCEENLMKYDYTFMMSCQIWLLKGIICHAINTYHMCSFE